jgi:hypothetical protein
MLSELVLDANSRNDPMPLGAFEAVKLREHHTREFPTALGGQ